MSTSSTPAGWYPNPHVPDQERFWDGSQWTEQTRVIESPPPWREAAIAPSCPLCKSPIAEGAVVCITCGARATSRGWVPSGAAGLAVSTLVGVRRTNGLAIASMVLGILYLCGIGSVLALVFGYIAKSQIDESGGMQAGRGMAVAGIILGWVGVGIIILYFLFVGSLIGFGTSQ